MRRNLCICRERVENSWEMWFGSRVIANPRGGEQYVSFAQIGKEGEWEYKTDGYIVYYSEKETLYMVMLPQYAERQNEPIVTEEMKKQGANHSVALA